MKTALNGLVFKCIILSAICGGAVNAPAKAADYFPMAVGNQWFMRATYENQIMTIKMQVVAQHIVHGKTEYTLDYHRNSTPCQREVYIGGKNGVYRTEGGPAGLFTVNPPIPMIEYPLVKGKKWRWSGVIHGSHLTSDFHVIGPVQLKTPAGKFDTMKIQQTINITSQAGTSRVTNIFWFAKGIGIVRQFANLGLTTIKMVLTKYHLAS